MNEQEIKNKVGILENGMREIVLILEETNGISAEEHDKLIWIISGSVECQPFASKEIVKLVRIQRLLDYLAKNHQELLKTHPQKQKLIKWYNEADDFTGKLETDEIKIN